MINTTKLISIISLLAIWQLISAFSDPTIFPSVVDIAINFKDHLIDGDLLENLLITLYRVVVTFFITMFLGIVFGVMMGLSEKLNDAFDYLLVLGLNIPALVIVVICFIWFGLTDFAALLAVILNKVPIVIVNIREGTRAIEQKYMELAKVYKISRYEVLFKIFLPQIYPYMMASTRLSLSLIWKIVLVVELLGLSSGIGFSISMFFQFFDITSILSYSLAFVFVIIAIEYLLLRPLEQKINFWKK